LLHVSPARAQEVEYLLVDRIAAIVGATVIPVSRLDEQVNILRQQGGRVPDDSAGMAEVRHQLLKSIIDDELLVQAALRDTAIVVQEQDVQTAVERAMREVRGQFASELEFRRQLETSNFGTVEEYRRWLADQQRRELLRDQLIQRLREMGQLSPLAPTEAELRAFYEETKAQQPQRPETVGFHQIVIRIEADSVAIAAARRLADSLVTELRDGADFGALARRYSGDPGSREQGGELGWVRRGVFVPEFDAVAFRLRPGVISPPFRTVFGFHIMEVQRSQPAEVQVRHILIQPAITEADRARARARGEEVAGAVRNGAPFDSLVGLYHDAAGQEQVLVADFPRNELPQTYQDALSGATPGDVIGPVLLDVGDGRPKFAVIRLDEIRPAGEYSFEDLRDRLRDMLSNESAMNRYLKTLRESTYIEIRP
jgi:peptidyl-prolyl cis-trans isomerase SurA